MTSDCFTPKLMPGLSRACLQGLNRVVSFAYAQYLIEDPENRDYRVIASVIPEGDHGYETAHRTGVIGQVFRIGRPIFVPDARSHPLYDSFDSNIEWELCVPLLREGNCDGVINLEGIGPFQVDEKVWCDIAESILTTTGRAIASSPPHAEDLWSVITARVVVAPVVFENHVERPLTVARALARDGHSTLLVGDYPELLRGRTPNPDDLDSGARVSYCCYGVEHRLDLLATGPRSSKTVSTRTDWWEQCAGRYSFVVLGT